MRIMEYEQHVVFEFNNHPMSIERFVSNKPITKDMVIAHYKRYGADVENGLVKLVEPPITIHALWCRL